MSNLSSIHFKKSTRFQVYHNDKIRPSYVIDSVDKVECNRPSEEARLLCDDIIAKAKQRYYETSRARNKNFQSTNYLQSAVVNIKPDTSMDDLEKLANHFQNKYGFQCYQISIHRDEGHIDDDGEKHINHHAHMEFVTLHRDTGKSCFRLNKTALREIQTETAKILGMERGKAGNKRIEPRKWAILKEQEKQATKELKAENKALKQDLEQVKAENKQLKADLVSQKAVNSAFEEIRQLMIADGISTADDYKELAKYKKQAQAQQKQGLTQAELNNQIAQIKLSYDEKLKAKDEELKAKDEKIEKLEKAIEPIKEYTEPLLDDIIDIYTKTPADAGLYIKKLWREREQDFINYRQWKKELKEELEKKYNTNNEPTSQNNSDDVENRINDLKAENKQLKAENQALKSTIEKLSTLKEYIATYFHDAVSKYLSFMKNTNQLDKAIDIETKEQQLTPKADIQRNTNTQNKGRGGR